MTGAVLAAICLGGLPIPDFLDAGNGAQEVPISGTLSVPYPASVDVGDFILLHVVDVGAPASITTPGGFTLIQSVLSSDTVTRSSVFSRLATGSEGGTSVEVTAGSGTRTSGRIYRFSGGSNVELITTFSSDISGPTITLGPNGATAGRNRLAVALAYGGGSVVIGDCSGESGVDLVEAVGEYNPAGTVMQLQTGNVVDSGTTLAEGVASFGGSVPYRIGISFCIIP